MSNKLNNFWDDCLEEKIISFNYKKSRDKKNHILSSNRTKFSISKANVCANLYKNNSNVLTKKSKYLKKYKTNNNKKNNISGFSTLKSEKSSNYDASRNKSNIKKIKDSNLSKKYNIKNNSNSSLYSLDLKLKKNLSECTFNPKLISNIKNKDLKEKLYNYSKFTMYERGQIFEMKKKEDNNRIFIEEYKKRNIKYPFKPEIHKCPSFKKVIFNDSNYDSLNYFYSRMNSARENKIYKNKIMPFEMINYEEIYKNENDLIHDNDLSYIYDNKFKTKRKSNHSLLMTRILNEKEAELCKQNLHNTLMSLKLSESDL